MAIDLTNAFDETAHTAEYYETFDSNGYLRRFNMALRDIAENPSLDGTVEYFTATEQNSLTYWGGTPFQSLYKLTPGGFFLQRGFDYQGWRDYEPDPFIRNRFRSLPLDTRTDTNTAHDLPDEFVYFPLQYMSAQKHMIHDVMGWARENRKHVVFKNDPHSIDHNNPGVIWDEAFAEEGSEFVHLLFNGNDDYLISRCSSLWTEDSGVGLQAVLAGKPVAYFHRGPAHMFGPVATFCEGVEDAARAEPVDPVVADQYLSWFYHELAIDLSTNYYHEQIKQRIKDWNNGFSLNPWLQDIQVHLYQQSLLDPSEQDLEVYHHNKCKCCSV